METPRKLAAILAADVAGYSTLTGLDEEGTLKRLRKLHQELINPAVSLHRGRIVKTTGDGILIEFASVVDAVRCAVDVQRGVYGRNADVPLEEWIEFRVGINIGDVVVEGDDLLGDGVNVAARLEGISEPGGICISESAYQQVRDKLDMPFEDAGEQQFKNILRPVRAYRLRLDRSSRQGKAAFTLPNKPSIAVLPFQNMSGDPEQEYFADGIVEEIITALSRFRQLFVIARNSSFTYKGRPVDVKQAGRELGVRYVLEGSVRKAKNRIRITAKLIDTRTGSHLWANRFEGNLEDIFDLQDQITANVVGAIAPKLEQVEIEHAKHKTTENLGAYDYYLRGMGNLYQWTQQSVRQALHLFHKAIEVDPEFASAHGMAAYCCVQRKSHGWFTDRQQEILESARFARRAADLGKDDAIALSEAAHTLAYVVGDVDSGVAFIDQALAINPNLAAAWYVSGWIRIWLGEPEHAIEHLMHSAQLSPPFDPLIFHVHAAIAYAHFFAGRHTDAARWAEKALSVEPDYLTAIRGAAVSYVLIGRLDDARKLMIRMRALDSALRLSNLKELLPLRRSEDYVKWNDALRKAGLPE